MDSKALLGEGLTCFIISPIGNRLDPRGTEGHTRYEDNIQMWADVLEPACEVFGLKAIRSDKIAAPGEITDQIFQYLRDADVVIADLSNANPNVMYELGLRHTRDKVTIQIGEYGRLPFDVNTIRTIQFQRTEAGLIDARKSLTEAIGAGLDGKGSPVAATRVWNYEAGANEESVAHAVELSSVDDLRDQELPPEPGFIDILAEGEESMGEVTMILGEARSLMEQLGTISAGSTEQIRESDSKNRGFAGRVLVARQLASDLSEPAALFEERANDYLQSVAKLDAMMDYLLSRSENDPDELAQSGEFFRPTLGLIDAADTSSVPLTEFSDVARNLRKIAKDLAPASKTIERSLARYLKGNKTISDWRPRVEALLEQLDE